MTGWLLLIEPVDEGDGMDPATIAHFNERRTCRGGLG